MKTSAAALLFLATTFALSTSFAREGRTGARAALQALPAHFAREVVRLSADNGRPDPTRWYVLARNRSEAGLFVKNPLYSITIADGQISEAKRFVDARQIFNRRNFINIPSVRIDSSVAFSIARNALGPAGQGMRSASYQLTQRGRAADPIWEVWAYGSSNRYLGVVKLSARTGTVMSTEKTRFPRL
jgi:hypothetical protein